MEIFVHKLNFSSNDIGLDHTVDEMATRVRLSDDIVDIELAPSVPCFKIANEKKTTTNKIKLADNE